jgi:hypothetical protein
MQKQEKSKKPLLILSMMVLLIGLLTFSCYKDYGMEVKDYDLVTAFYDKTADFTTFQTFMMPDSILHLVKEGEKDNISRKFDSMVLAQVNVNMQTMGYTELEAPSESNTPDIIVVVAVTTTDNYFLYGGYPYWPPYYPYYPGGGWYYPWYPVYGVSSYSTGTVLVSLADANQYDPDREAYKAVWIGAVNGLLDDTDANISNRLTTGINEMFRISPYLGAE